MLKTVATFDFPHEAHLAKAKLESEGIPAFVADEHTINMQWLYSNAMGGVRLQVPGSVLEQAQEILSQDFSANLEKEFGSTYYTCPRCGSSDIGFYTKGKVMAYLMFILMQFPLWPHKKKIACKNCGVLDEYET